MTETSSAAGVPRPAWNRSKTWQCSTSRLTVNCVAASSSRSVRVMWRQCLCQRPGQRSPAKNGRLVRFEITQPTREALDNCLRMTNCKAGEYLFPGGPKSRPTLEHATVCSPRMRVGRWHRSRPQQVRDAFPASNEATLIYR
jgi:hypothetical protein